MVWTLVGIDCATQEEHLGLALGRLDDAGELTIERVTLGTAGESAEATVGGWLRSASRYLVAINAPLGWPMALAPTLSKHRAGMPLGDSSPDQLMRRMTERTVQTHTGRAPSEVTAERLMRRAISALDLLQRIRVTSGHPLELAWVQTADSGVLEVRARATLRALSIQQEAYRGRTHKARHAREAIVDALQMHARLSVSTVLLTENADLLDAAIGVLAAADFARGLCVAPTDTPRAKREGWIWFRSDGQRELFG